MAKQLKVEIVGDSKSLSSALRSADNSASGFGSSIAKVGKVAAIAAGAAGIGAIAVTLKAGISEWQQQTAVAAQTEAVLKSTGGVANVTAKDLDTLATSLMKKTGIDDEAIKSSGNLLLGFTNIRNEVGKGNDIFNQAAVAVQNYSARTGKDATSASILFGKALNDPIKGMSALARVGIQFTEDQKKQIKAQVESGHVMEAQKTILAGLEQRFGGAAEAAGKTLPGQLRILREMFNNVAGELVGRLVPALEVVVSWLTENWDSIGAGINTAFNALRQGVNVAVELAQAFAKHKEVLLPIAGAILGIVLAMEAWAAITKAVAVAQLALNAVMAANPIGIIVVAIAAAVAALAVLYTSNERFRNFVNSAWPAIQQIISSVVNYISGLWKKWGADIISTATTALNTTKAVIQAAVAIIRAIWDRFGADIVSLLRNAFNTLAGVVRGQLQIIQGIIKTVTALIHGDWGKAWEGIKQIVSGVFQVITSIMRGAVTALGIVAKAIGREILNGIKAGLSALKTEISQRLNDLQGALASVASQAFGWAANIGRQIVSGILSGLSGLYSALKSKAESIIGSVLGGLNIPGGSPPEHAAAEMVGKPLARGVIQGFLLGTAELPAKMSEKLRASLEAARNQVEAAQAAFSSAFQRLAGDAMRAFDAETDRLVGIIDKKLAAALAKIESQRKELTPAEAEIAALQANIERQRQTDELTAAQKALAEAVASGDAAAIQAANFRIQQIQQEIFLANLQIQAAKERAAVDAAAAKQTNIVTASAEERKKQLVARREQERRALEELLADLETELAKHPGAWRKHHGELMKLLAKLGADYKTAGQNVGAAFAQGIRDSIKDIEAAAKEAAAVVAANLKTKSPTEEGPMRDLDQWWDKFVPTLVKGLDVRGLGATVTATAAQPPMAMAGSGGAVYNITFPNYLGSRREVVDEIRSEITKLGRRN